MFQWSSVYNSKRRFLFCIGVVFLFSSHTCLGMYNNEEDYKIHQKVSNTFFRLEPKKKETVNILKKFKEEYAVSPVVSDIKLDGLAPRSRILLLRSVSQEIFNKYEKEKEENILYSNKSYFREYKGIAASKKTIKYFFGSRAFVVGYNPTDMQPGNLIIHDFLECKDFYNAFNNLKNKNRSKSISGYFIKQYKNQLVDEKSEQNYPIIFFDFEIARRLTQDVPQNEHDGIPIASAIINFLNLTQISDEHHVSKLFNPPDTELAYYSMKDEENEGFWEYKEYNPFEGKAWMREAATKNILLDMNKKINKKLKKKEILEQYYDFFGGKEED